MLVNVILPIYKPNAFVFEAIDSVLSQTYTNLHLSIVDDFSNDGMLNKILDNYYDNRISFIKLQTRHRAAGARMKAIHETDGDIISFIDQDDIWHPNKLQKQVSAFCRNINADAVHTDIDIIDEKSVVINESNLRENMIRADINWDELSKIALAKVLFKNNRIRLVTSAIKREAFDDVGGFDSSIFGGEDWEFWVRFALFHKIAHLPEIFVAKRVHKQNTSAVCSFERLDGKFAALKKIATLYDFFDDLIPSMEENLIFQGLRESRNLKEMIIYLRLIIKKYPIDILRYYQVIVIIMKNILRKIGVYYINSSLKHMSGDK